MNNSINQKNKVPAFVAMMANQQKILKEIEEIYNAPVHVLSDHEKKDKGDALLMSYEREANKLSKWDNFIQVDCEALPAISLNISNNAINPHRTLLIFNLLLSSISRNGRSSHTAKTLSKQLNCHINHVYPSLKWLRENDIISNSKTADRSPSIVYIMSNDAKIIYISDWIVRKRRSIQQHIKSISYTLHKEEKRQKSINDADLFYKKNIQNQSLTTSL